jgi:aminopeptidase N
VRASPQSNSDSEVSRAKSLLLFYALRQRIGDDAFQKAIEHMLYARRQRGFDLSDFISALEEESHQDIGPFVRRWIKRPGVPDEFRATYSQSSAKQETIAQEATP